MKREDSVVELVRSQKALEESIVKAVQALESKVHDQASRLILAELRLDSTKHADICQGILDVIDKAEPERLWDARIESYVDMQVTKKALESHILLEEAMLKHVERVIAESKDEAIRLLFTHIAEDEKKHHRNIELIIRRSYALAR
jgi:hypothetical protein